MTTVEWVLFVVIMGVTFGVLGLFGRRWWVW